MSKTTLKGQSYYFCFAAIIILLAISKSLFAQAAHTHEQAPEPLTNIIENSEEIIPKPPTNIIETSNETTTPEPPTNIPDLPEQSQTPSVPKADTDVLKPEENIMDQTSLVEVELIKNILIEKQPSIVTEIIDQVLSINKTIQDEDLYEQKSEIALEPPTNIIEDSNETTPEPPVYIPDFPEHIQTTLEPKIDADALEPEENILDQTSLVENESKENAPIDLKEFDTTPEQIDEGIRKTLKPDDNTRKQTSIVTEIIDQEAPSSKNAIQVDEMPEQDEELTSLVAKTFSETEENDVNEIENNNKNRELPILQIVEEDNNNESQTSLTTAPIEELTSVNLEKATETTPEMQIVVEEVKHQKSIIPNQSSYKPIQIIKIAEQRLLPKENTTITADSVFGTINILNKSVEMMLKAREIILPKPSAFMEKGLGPMHVYQLIVTSIQKLREFDLQIGTNPLPLIVVSPLKYTPADVKIVANMLVCSIQRDASFLKIEGLPTKETKFTDKTPTDVFQEVLRLYINLSALSDTHKIDSNTVYAEIVRAVTDVKSVLGNIDPASRYKIDSPVSKLNLTPTDVFQQCLTVRQILNKVRQDYKMETVPTPVYSSLQQMQPFDIFVQTQIIIAEVNILKTATNTNSVTPVAIPVTEKKTSDVHQQLSLLQYLLNQIETIKDFIKQKGKH